MLRLSAAPIPKTALPRVHSTRMGFLPNLMEIHKRNVSYNIKGLDESRLIPTCMKISAKVIIPMILGVKSAICNVHFTMSHTMFKY